MHKKGLVHGRFQLLHNDHMKYVLAAKERCRHLVIGITNPEPSLTGHDDADPKRSRPESNPLTYDERRLMLEAALADEKIPEDEFSIVPFPINFPELYSEYVPLDAVFFLTIYDRWGERKLELFESLGIKTEIMWRKPLSLKGITSTEVRCAIAEGKQWRQLVPPAVARIIEDLGIEKRIRK